MINDNCNNKPGISHKINSPTKSDVLTPIINVESETKVFETYGLSGSEIVSKNGRAEIQSFLSQRYICDFDKFSDEELGEWLRFSKAAFPFFVKIDNANRASQNAML